MLETVYGLFIVYIGIIGKALIRRLKTIVLVNCVVNTYICLPLTGNMRLVKLNDKFFRPFIGQEKIQEAIHRLADSLNEDLKGTNPMFLVVLNGSFMFASDLLKELNLLPEIAFIKISSYAGTVSTGEVKELMGLNDDVKGRELVILEDIIDTGTTVESLYRMLKEKGAKKIKIVSLLFKPEAYKKNIPVDYAGICIPNDFVVGYGLDYNGLGRNLKEIYVVTEN